MDDILPKYISFADSCFYAAAMDRQQDEVLLLFAAVSGLLSKNVYAQALMFYNLKMRGKNRTVEV